MHSSLVRLQNTFGYLTTLLALAGALIAATDFLAPRTPSGTIKTTNVQV
jgi:signal peptidase complex subunit 3